MNRRETFGEILSATLRDVMEYFRYYHSKLPSHRPALIDGIGK